MSFFKELFHKTEQILWSVFLKPFFFSFDPEKVHHFVVGAMKLFSPIFYLRKSFYHFKLSGENHPSLEKEVFDEYGNCGGAWMVGGAFAESGWGPLLYDVAIEWATENAGGLISDRGSVSLEAQQVWNYYLNNRTDVKEHQLDTLDNQLTPVDEDNCDQSIARSTITGMYSSWQDSALSKRYTKAPTTTNALKAAGQLVIL